MTCLVLLQCASSCASGGNNNTDRARFQENSLLWIVQASNGATSYVFGTIHIAVSSTYVQRDTVLKALAASTLFFAEIDLDSATQMSNISKMLLPDGKTLADFFTPEEMQELRSALDDRLGPMASMAERMRPGALIGLLMLDLDAITGEAVLGMDQFLWQQATSLGIQRRGIETVAEQLALLDSIPARMILEVIRDTTTNTAIHDLLDAYAREDLSSIVHMVDSLSSIETFMMKVNDDRNVRIAERLLTPLERGGAFIAVGAAHLGGTQGLLAELDRMGFRVRPVIGGERSQWLLNGNSQR